MAIFKPEIIHGSEREPERNARAVRIAPGIATESPIRWYVNDWEGYDLELDVTAEPAVGERAGHLFCQSLTVRQREGGPPVTSEGIRAVPIATLVRQVASTEFLAIEEANDNAFALSDRTLDDQAVARIKREGPTDEALRWVAFAYRIALVLGEPPTRAVEKGLRLPRSTAGRWVSLARERGYLGEAEGPGKAGG